MEAPRDLLVSRVHAQRQVGGGHHRRVFLRRIVSIGNQVLGLAVLRGPLMGASRALGQLPLVTEQHVEVAVVPGGGIGLPGTLDAAGSGVHALAAAELVDPAQALFFDTRGFRLRTDQRRIACAVGLAKGVTASHQGHGFLIVHRHAGEGFAHITAGRHRIRVAIRAFGVHIDQAHLHRRQRVIELAIALITAIGLVTGGQPLALGTPVDILFRFPDIGTATGKTEGLEAHGFQGDVTGQDEQVGPGNLAAVFLLDRPQQTAGLVQVAVVRPAVERGKALVAGAGTAAAILNPVGAGSVPGHADHQATVVAPVGRPPVLGVGHQRREVLDQGIKVQLLEFFGVVERLPHGVGLGRMLMKDAQLELIGPPVGIRRAAGNGVFGSTGSERAFGFV